MAPTTTRRWRLDELPTNTGNSISDDVVLEFLDGESIPAYQKFSTDGEEDEDTCTLEEKKKFWDSQTHLLEAVLYRTSSLESKIRQTTKRAVKGITMRASCGACRDSEARGCRDCIQREVALSLRDQGLNCFICKSKWRTTPSIPAGEHRYLEVVEKLSSTRETRVIIEVNFRSEFEMAIGNREYTELIKRLPEVYVGKMERLHDVIKIVCDAAKTCMKEKKMHLGPWRKQKYMESKWLGACEKILVAESPSLPAPFPIGFSDRKRKPRSSMLTYDLLNSMPVLQPALKVL